MPTRPSLRAKKEDADEQEDVTPATGANAIEEDDDEFDDSLDLGRRPSNAGPSEAFLFATRNSKEDSFDDGSDSDDDERRHSQSPSDTVRDLRRPPRASDRRRWKNLRDFVDDRAIDQVLEAMDEERAALDVGEVWNAQWGGRR